MFVVSMNNHQYPHESIIPHFWTNSYFNVMTFFLVEYLFNQYGRFPRQSLDILDWNKPGKSVYLSIYLSVCLYIYRSIYQSIYCIYLIYLSIYPSIHPSIYLCVPANTCIYCMYIYIYMYHKGSSIRFSEVCRSRLLFLLLLHFGRLLFLGLLSLLRGLTRLPLLAPQRRAAVVFRVGDVVAVAVVGEEHLEFLANQHHLVQGSVDGKIVMVWILDLNRE